MTLIEISSYRNGWKVFEAPSVEPVFLEKDQAINYAQNRASFRSGEIRIFDSSGADVASAERNRNALMLTPLVLEIIAEKAD